MVVAFVFTALLVFLVLGGLLEFVLEYCGEEIEWHEEYIGTSTIWVINAHRRQPNRK